SELLCDVLVFHSRLEDHAGAELIDDAALDFLPRRLRGGVVIAADRLVRAARSMQMRSPDRSSARPPPAAASGDAFRIDGEAEVPDWRPSPMQGSTRMPR